MKMYLTISDAMVKGSATEKRMELRDRAKEFLQILREHGQREMQKDLAFGIGYEVDGLVLQMLNGSPQEMIAALINTGSYNGVDNVTLHDICEKPSTLPIVIENPKDLIILLVGYIVGESSIFAGN